MKKIFAVLMAAVMVMALCLTSCKDNDRRPGSGNIPSGTGSSAPDPSDSSDSSSAPSSDVSEASKPDPEEITYHDSYYELVGTISKEGAVCGSAYIANLPDYEGMGYEFMFEVGGYHESFPFIYDIPEERYIDLGGPEMYCIVPLPNSKVEVRGWDPYADGEDEGELFYSSENGEPFIIFCNKDYESDVQITVAAPEGQELTFSPYYMAGIFDGDAWGYDFSTVYPTFEDDAIILSAAELAGDWLGTYYAGDVEYTMHLYVWDEGNGTIGCNYWYETSGQAGYVNYIGTITDEILFDEKTGWVDLDLLNSDEKTDHFLGNYLFQLDAFDPDVMYAIHYEGTPLVPGGEYVSCVFTRVYG